MDSVDGSGAWICKITRTGRISVKEECHVEVHGRTIATTNGIGPNGMRLDDVESGTQLVKMVGHRHFVNSAAWCWANPKPSILNPEP